MIKLTDREKAYQLYDNLKRIILENEENPSYKYQIEYCLSNLNTIEDEIKNKYFDEKGIVKFKNINGDNITLKIQRWHQHLRWSRYGIYEVPSFQAEIYVENQIVWSLYGYHSDSFTEVSSLEIPGDILIRKQLSSNPDIQEIEIKEITENTIEEQNQIIEPQEKRILFDEIANLYNRYKSAEKTKEELLLKRRKEIEEATEKIIKSYSQKLTQNNEEITFAKEELNAFDNLLTTYSTFDMDLVGNAIQQLISIVESETYSYKEAIYKFKKRVHGAIDSWDEDIQIKTKMVVKKDKFRNCYDSTYEGRNEIHELVKNGEAILLSEQNINSHNNKITFYTSEDGQIRCHVDFGILDYIKVFIDSIIQYRFQNNIVEFTEKDMLPFIKNFIVDHKDIIIETYSSKVQKKALNLKFDIS